MSNLIVVTGVTGTQGSSVANTFLTLPNWTVRGITRNPSSPAALALSSKGVQIVHGDFDDKSSLTSVFKGATAIFSNTDFFVHLFHGLTPGVTPPGKTVNKYACDREVEQGLNIAEAAADPEVLKTLKHFILSSLADSAKWSNGKYKNIQHFNSKAEMIRGIHAKFPELGKKMSTLQVGHYVTNWKAFPAMAPQKQRDGSFLLMRPVGPKQVLPFVVVKKDTGVFVKALVEVSPGKDLWGVSELMTFAEWIELWGQVLGVKVGYKQVSGDDFFDLVPESLKVELMETYDFVEEFGYIGGDPDVLLPSQLGIENSLTSMEEYIRGEDWSSVLDS